MKLFPVFLYDKCRLWILIPSDVVNPVNSLIVASYNCLLRNKSLNFGFIIYAAIDANVSNEFDAIEN